MACSQPNLILHTAHPNTFGKFVAQGGFSAPIALRYQTVVELSLFKHTCFPFSKNRKDFKPKYAATNSSSLMCFCFSSGYHMPWALCPLQTALQPKVDASVAIFIVGLPMVIFLHALGRLVTHQLRSLTDSEERVIVAS